MGGFVFLVFCGLGNCGPLRFIVRRCHPLMLWGHICRLANGAFCPDDAPEILEDGPFQKRGLTCDQDREWGNLPSRSNVKLHGAARPSPGPLSHFSDGSFLTRATCRFVVMIRSALLQAGIDAKPFLGHSFRIGVATTAALCGIQDSLIKVLGRWQSSAYQLYIWTTSRSPSSSGQATFVVPCMHFIVVQATLKSALHLFTGICVLYSITYIRAGCTQVLSYACRQ